MNGVKFKDVDAFFEEVNACEGTVELITDKGDRLNLKSILTQYISAAKFFSRGEMNGIEVVTSLPEEGMKLRAALGNY